MSMYTSICMYLFVCWRKRAVRDFMFDKIGKYVSLLYTDRLKSCAEHVKRYEDGPTGGQNIRSSGVSHNMRFRTRPMKCRRECVCAWVVCVSIPR